MGFAGGASEGIGFNLYLWDMEAQNRALVRYIVPQIRALRTAGDVDFFWFDRNDLRGPHLFTLVGVSPGRADHVRSVLRDTVDRFLSECPSQVVLDPEHLQSRHDACFERFQSTVDQEDGFADDNTVRELLPTGDSAPFSWDRNGAVGQDFWALVTELSLWSAELMDPSGKGASMARALCWLADLDRAVGDGDASKSYWTYHLACDVPGFRDVLSKGESIAAVMAHRKIGPKNRQVFSEIWALGETEGPSWVPIKGLVEAAVDLEADAPSRRWFLLREVVHCALKQMGLKVRDHILLGLYAWSVHHPVPKEFETLPHA